MQLNKQRQESLDKETKTYLEQLKGREAEIQELEKRRQQAVRSRNINLKWVQGIFCCLQLPCSCHLPLSLGNQSQRPQCCLKWSRPGLQMRRAALERAEGAGSWQAGADITSSGCCIAKGLLPGSHAPQPHRSGLQESGTNHSGL